MSDTPEKKAWDEGRYGGADNEYGRYYSHEERDAFRKGVEDRKVAKERFEKQFDWLKKPEPIDDKPLKAASPLFFIALSIAPILFVLVFAVRFSNFLVLRHFSPPFAKGLSCMTTVLLIVILLKLLRLLPAFLTISLAAFYFQFVNWFMLYDLGWLNNYWTYAVIIVAGYLGAFLSQGAIVQKWSSGIILTYLIAPPALATVLVFHFQPIWGPSLDPSGKMRYMDARKEYENMRDGTILETISPDTEVASMGADSFAYLRKNYNELPHTDFQKPDTNFEFAGPLVDTSENEFSIVVKRSGLYYLASPFAFRVK